MKHIVLLALNNQSGSALITPLEILSQVAESQDLKLTVATLSGGPVVSRSGLEIAADQPLAEVGSADAIMITSCLDYQSDPEQQTAALCWLREQHRQGTLVGALGTGIVFMALSGLLENRTATADWQGVSRLREAFPDVDFDPRHTLIECDGLVSCAGGYAGDVLSLYMVEQLFDKDTAERCAAELMLDTERFWQNRHPGLLEYRLHRDNRIHAVQSWLDKHFAEKINLEALARRNSMSQRNFVRRFKEACGETPLGYVQRLRIEEAKRLLEQSDLSVEAICDRVGYLTESHFRQLFKPYVKMTPARYRGQMSGQARSGRG